MSQPLQCYSCGVDIVTEHVHICPLCDQSYCYEHKEPEAHNCVKLGTEDWNVYRHERELWRKKNPRITMGDRQPIDYEQVRTAHEIRHINPEQDRDNLKPQKQDWSLLKFIVIAIIALMIIYLMVRNGFI